MALGTGLILLYFPKGFTSRSLLPLQPLWESCPLNSRYEGATGKDPPYLSLS